LRRTLDAAARAATQCANLDVLINGAPQLAKELLDNLQARPLDRPAGLTLRIWSIPLGDKANAWNQYIHHLWAGQELVFFIDGYVRLNSDAIEQLGGAVQADPQALGGSGVPTVGRSARALRQNMLVNGGFHGNLCCLKAGVLAHMRQSSVFLPVGLYRTDSLMGALLCFGLDPSTCLWEDYRIHVQGHASWQLDPPRWWRVNDVLAYSKRLLRQGRGQLEKLAIAEHLVTRLQAPQSLPRTARELVLNWAERDPAGLQSALRSQPWLRLALWQLRSAVVSPLTDRSPTLLSRNGA
jgi:hypothetical protein